MCRAKGEGDRRCGCDTTEKRRLRYGISVAKQLFRPFQTKPPKPNFLPSVVDEEAFTVETLKQDIENLYSFSSAESRTTANLMEQDRNLNTIGEGIEYLASTKYGSPSDEMLRAAEEASARGFELGQPKAQKLYNQYRSELLAEGFPAHEAHEEAASRVSTEMRPESHVILCSLLEKRNEAYKAALCEVGVVFADPHSLIVSEDSEPEAVEGLRAALAFYPQSWVDASNEAQEDIPLYVVECEARGYYEEDNSSDFPTAILGIRTDEDFFVGDKRTSNATHEFAHRIESVVPSVALSETAFLFRRSGQLSIQREDGSISEPEELSFIDAAKKEQGYRDNFPVHYMGKVYEENIFSGEVVSMGMEALFTGKFGGLSGMEGYSSDPDYRKFLLGLLASSAKK